MLIAETLKVWILRAHKRRGNRLTRIAIGLAKIQPPSTMSSHDSRGQETPGRAPAGLGEASDSGTSMADRSTLIARGFLRYAIRRERMR